MLGSYLVSKSTAAKTKPTDCDIHNYSNLHLGFYPRGESYRDAFFSSVLLFWLIVYCILTQATKSTPNTIIAVLLIFHMHSMPALERWDVLYTLCSMLMVSSLIPLLSLCLPLREQGRNTPYLWHGK